MKCVKELLESGKYKIVDSHTGRVLHPSLDAKSVDTFVRKAMSLRSAKQKEEDDKKIIQQHLGKEKMLKKNE